MVNKTGSIEDGDGPMEAHYIEPFLVCAVESQELSHVQQLFSVLS